MSAALSRADYVSTGQRVHLDIPTWSRSFKHVEMPYSNEQARKVVFMHTPWTPGDESPVLSRRLAAMALERRLFGFMLAVDPFDETQRVLLNIVVPAGCVIEEAKALNEVSASLPTSFLTRTIDVHSLVRISPRGKRIEQVEEAMIPVAEYAFTLGINKLPEGGDRQFAFKVDAGNVLRDAGVSLPVEVRTRPASLNDDWTF
jgi:hypothetical protein